jgi:hypothetical protein
MWPSSVTLRGTRGKVDASALGKSVCAVAMPRSRRSRKSLELRTRCPEMHQNRIDTLIELIEHDERVAEGHERR